MKDTSQAPSLTLLTSPDWLDYELLDSGNGQKLERYGSNIFVRPEVQAVWQPSLPASRWQAAHAVFIPSQEENGGHWQYRLAVQNPWVMSYKGLRFNAQTSGSRHLGVFPEQACHWDWVREKIAAADRPLNVLNLFGYTGLATLAAAAAGARVTHVDASNKAVAMAKENQALSGLSDKPIRWIVDDAVKFVRREARRKTTYDGIILDPPKFGRGPQGEVWEFYRLLPALLYECRQILDSRPTFVVLTAYAIQSSSVTMHNAVKEMMSGLKGEVTAGELVSQEKSAGRFLSHALFARWAAKS
ncbi:MAG TPA: class I SAM-dependent methyltransferase [Anaerolineaceae bacterium]|nr:class I SAM-dependent methyltransferase [Anaerolineaceae bacterium]HPN52675.1 class I SAM-dependent methyltransferase [Anaerolineaceae bacterium]